MKMFTIFAMAAGLLMSCADFPETYENVIEGQKIRPFATVLNPPEAAPGDTVEVFLHLYDADKEYSAEWTLQLDYTVDNYAYLSSAGKNLNLDSMKIPIPDSDADGRLHFRFVVPRGEHNPFYHSPLVPEIQVPAGEISSETRELLESSGIEVAEKGLTSRSLVEYLDERETVPAEFAPLANEMIALIRLNAKIKSEDFELDVDKRLTVRYSNRLESGGSINSNPALNSIGIITVKKKGINEPEKISGFEADTQYFSTNAASLNSGDPLPVDTFLIKKDWSYFLIADTGGAAQRYVSPSGKTHSEHLFYQWFYTNLDETGADWDELIEVGDGDSDPSLPVVTLKVPKDRGMKNFMIRVSVGDWRPEWALLSSTGLAYLEARGYFKYED
jgi:hypothetical protein